MKALLLNWTTFDMKPAGRLEVKHVYERQLTVVLLSWNILSYFYKTLPEILLLNLVKVSFKKQFWIVFNKKIKWNDYWCKIVHMPNTNIHVLKVRNKMYSDDNMWIKIVWNYDIYFW